MRLVRLLSTGCALSLLFACDERGRAAQVFTTEPNREHLCPDCTWRLTLRSSVDSTQIHREEDETATMLAELGLDTETLAEDRWEWSHIGVAWPGAADDSKPGGLEHFYSSYDYAASLDEGTRDINAYERFLTREEAEELVYSQYTFPY